jgi:hypothetical protein
MIDEVELPLVADKLLADALDASGEGDGGVGGEPEPRILSRARRRRRVGEKALRRRFQLEPCTARRRRSSRSCDR